MSPSEQQRDTRAQETRSLVFAWPGSLVCARDVHGEKPPKPVLSSPPSPRPAKQNLCVQSPGFSLPKRGPRVPSSFDPFQPTALQDFIFPPVCFKSCSKASLALLRQVLMARNIPMGHSGTTCHLRSHSCTPQLPTLLPHIAGGSLRTHGPTQNSPSVCRMKLGVCNTLILTSSN